MSFSSTPSSNRLRLTPSNSPFLVRPAVKSPMRGGPGAGSEPRSRLSLRRVVGTTCSSPTGFDTVSSSFAYIAGGAVVVVDVNPAEPLGFTQRFFRARPTTQPVLATVPSQSSAAAVAATSATATATSPSAPTDPSTPKPNDRKNRAAAATSRDSPYSSGDWSDPPSGRTWTSRERIKAASCLSLSRDAKYLAVGETGYAPRVLVFSLQDGSSDVPLASVSEHLYGVKAVAWSQDTRYLASLGAANDGFLYVWKIDPRTGAVKIFQQNRCTSPVRAMFWMGSCLVTLGVRHLKAWRVDESPQLSPTKQKFQAETPSGFGQQKPLPGRNVLLGALLDATFTSAAVADEGRAIVCTDAGDVCLLEDDNRQMKLVHVLGLDFPISSITIREDTALIGGRAGQFASLDVRGVLNLDPDGALSVAAAATTPPPPPPPPPPPTTKSGVVALGFLTDNLVTVDGGHSVDIWSPNYRPGQVADDAAHIAIPGHGEPIMGIQPLARPNDSEAAFVTWSPSGRIILWDLEGRIKSRREVAFEQVPAGIDSDVANQLTCVRVAGNGRLVIAADKLGVLRIIDIVSDECLLSTKAHSADCQSMSICEGASRFLLASCGRDRSVQLFRRLAADGTFEHFQTLEFAARVSQVLIPSEHKLIACSLDRTMQIHDIVAKEGQGVGGASEVLAAICSRVITLKASPTSMTIGTDHRSVFVSLLDRSVGQWDITTGKQIDSFKCADECGLESAVLDSLTMARAGGRDVIVGISNTDKSVRIYDAQTGGFLDREWGHTESINGVALAGDEAGGQTIVSVGSDGTIMVWTLGTAESQSGLPNGGGELTAARDGVSSRPPLRKVLSRAELAEFPRRPPSSAGRRSPSGAVGSGTLQKRASKHNLLAKTSTTTRSNSTPLPPFPFQTNLAVAVSEQSMPSRCLTSSGNRSDSPPSSPKGGGGGRLRARRPSLPALRTAGRMKSSPNVRGAAAGGFGTLGMATEQACRTLRAYREKMASSADPVGAEMLAELGKELRLTAAAVGDWASRGNQVVSETVLSGLLDQYSDRLVSMLDEKLGLGIHHQTRPEREGKGNNNAGVKKKKATAENNDRDVLDPESPVSFTECPETETSEGRSGTDEEELSAEASPSSP